MTNFDYIMENMTVRDMAIMMNPTHSGFSKDNFVSKAWYAWNKHCEMMEGYQKGNVYSREKPVNPFRYSRYFSSKEDNLCLTNGHSNIVSYETWLCKQYNPEEWT